jgi:hypothetical protein
MKEPGAQATPPDGWVLSLRAMRKITQAGGGTTIFVEIASLRSGIRFANLG